MRSDRIYPVPSVDGRQPVISQEYKPHTHWGVDIMFRRLPSDPPYASGDPRGTTGFYVPANTPALAICDGFIEMAQDSFNGHRARLLHGNGFYSLYLHMYKLFVGPGDKVKMGDPVGIIGGDPSQNDPHHTVHLHYEIRKLADHSPVDPTPYLATYPVKAL